MTEKKQVIEIVDNTLESKELLDQPRALLLLRLCQFCVSLAPEKAEKYWLMLQKLTRSLPQENQAELAELRTSLEESVSTEKKGFAAEMLAEIDEIKKLDDEAQKKEKLQDCEARLKKRFNPLGKGPVWNALVLAWIPLDRKYAFQLMKNLSGKSQNDLLKRLNRALQITPGEWTSLFQILGNGKMENLVLEMLEDENQVIQLDDVLIEQLARKIRNGLAPAGVPLNIETIAKKLRSHTRLLGLHAKKEKAGLFSRLIAEMIDFLAGRILDAMGVEHGIYRRWGRS